MKVLLKLLLVTACIMLTSCRPDNAHRKIGIILPLEHRAMDAIVSGFTESLPQNTKEQFTIKVKNAQNDANIQRAIIQQMRDQHYSIIIPVGMNASQMAISMIHDRPIISLASEMTDAARQQLKPCNVAIVHDQISTKLILEFIHDALPSVTSLILIHSSDDKIYTEVKEAVSAAKALGITITPKMVTTLPELYTTVTSLPSTTQGLFVLKDHLIVSGVSTLAKAANDRRIPLITSDQGSVQDGAGFALAVSEKQIGSEGAKLAAAILSGKAPCDLPIVEMKNLTVFINAPSIKNENQNIDAIVNAAKKYHYTVSLMDQRGK